MISDWKLSKLMNSNLNSVKKNKQFKTSFKNWRILTSLSRGDIYKEANIKLPSKQTVFEKEARKNVKLLSDSFEVGWAFLKKPFQAGTIITQKNVSFENTSL